MCGISFFKIFLKAHANHLIIQNTSSQPSPLRLSCLNIRGIIAECSWRKQRQHEAAEMKSIIIEQPDRHYHGTRRTRSLLWDTQQLYLKILCKEGFETSSLLALSSSNYWELFNPTLTIQCWYLLLSVSWYENGLQSSHSLFKLATWNTHFISPQDTKTCFVFKSFVF